MAWMHRRLARLAICLKQPRSKLAGISVADEVKIMEVSYTLTLEDHLAWYDYFLASREGARYRSLVPVVGGFLNRLRRRSYSRQVIIPPNRHALGERTLEATEQGLREFSREFSFTTAWSDIRLVAMTSSHLFLAHASMNAHIVPLHYFKNEAEREAFASFARSRYQSSAV